MRNIHVLAYCLFRHFGSKPSKEKKKISKHNPKYVFVMWKGIPHLGSRERNRYTVVYSKKKKERENICCQGAVKQNETSP